MAEMNETVFEITVLLFLLFIIWRIEAIEARFKIEQKKSSQAELSDLAKAILAEIDREEEEKRKPASKLKPKSETVH